MIEFLTNLFHAGLSYSSLNTARSALSTYVCIDGIAAGIHPLVKRFMRGVFNLRPAFPKYLVTWDTDIVLKKIKSMSPVRVLSLKNLTYKLVMLLALLTGQRCQTIHALTMDSVTLTDNYVKLHAPTLLKHSRPGHHLQELKVKGYAPDRRMCIVHVLTEYMKRTKTIRTSDKLLISYVKPHHPVTKATVSRWVKHMLDLSGINTSIFQAHSTRSAATTSAKGLNVPLATILRTAGWSSESTFSKYYDKSEGNKDFASAIQSKAL